MHAYKAVQGGFASDCMDRRMKQIIRTEQSIFRLRDPKVPSRYAILRAWVLAVQMDSFHGFISWIHFIK
jgi:hypothetical protein